MKHLPILVVALILLFAALEPVDGGAPKKQEALVDQVKRSIDRGVGYLRRMQRSGGSWEIDALAAGVQGGETALTLLALLNAGVPVTDPMMARGMKYLRDMQPEFTYVRALQTMVFVEANQVEDRERIANNVQWLIGARVIRNGEFRGWSYRRAELQGSDNSNTQYALLGLHAGKQAGIKIDDEVWKSIRDFYTRTQTQGVRGGAWTYVEGPRPGPSLTMTTAGLCGLLIAGMELNDGREVHQPNGTFANCGVYKENEHVTRALDWITAHFQLDLPQSTYYNLYGIERVGRLSGLRFIGKHDWYREGCQYVVRQQKEDGSWEAGGAFDRWPVVSTSFALLFLSKGRTPILISKLVHGQAAIRSDEDTDWNNDRNDLRHLTDYASRKLFNKLHLAWQVFDMRRALDAQGDAAEVTSDMLQSPIVYFNGHKSPQFRFQDQEKDLLRKYVENGGFIVAEACCGSPEFDRGFKKLAEELWPDSPLEPLPATHPIWYAAGKDFQVTPGRPYKLLGINMGCKTVLVYSPEDLSCYWEAGDPQAPGGRRVGDEGRSILAFRLGANIIAYATGMQPPRPRLTHVDVARDSDPRIIPRGYYKVAQAKFNGDYKPAPRAMRNLMDHMRKFAALDVVLKTEEIPVHVSSIKDFKLIYLHGRGEFRYADEELGNLRFNLENGGLLFADACCGQEAFDKAFRKLAAQLFPKHMLERIPLDDVFFSKEMNGVALTEQNISCRQERNGTPQRMAPWLEGIKIDGRWVVVYSKYDIGCALERHQSSDCRGYTPESALKLASAAVLYTLRP